MPVKIVVVEDDELNRRLFESVLQKSGYTVATAGNGGEALSLIKDESPSLILIDLGLPDIDGIEVARRYREEAPSPAAKLYALTGAAHPDLSKAGFDGIILKPIRVMEFLRTVERILAGLPPNT